MSEFDIRGFWHSDIVMFLAGVLILVFAIIIYRRVRRKVNEIGKGSAV